MFLLHGGVPICFYHGDCDWYASVQDTTEEPATERVRCDECRDWIHKGEWVRHVYMQQYEDCRAGVVDEDDEGEQQCSCAPGECDYGEVFEYDCCERCAKVLKAIEQVETEAGCKGDSTRPALTELSDALWYEDGERYSDRARELHPELASHLDRFGRREFEEQWSRADLELVDELGGEGG